MSGPGARPAASSRNPPERDLERLRQAITIRDNWLGYGLSTDPADRPAAEVAITELYRAGSGGPRFIWVESPGAAPQHDAYWVAHYDAWRRLGMATFSGDDSRQLDLWATLARSCGRWWPYEGVCVVAERPAVVRAERVPGGRHGELRLHNAEGAAVQYPDGWSVHAWHGTLVPAWVISSPTVERITAESNIEVRRCAIERVGWDTYIDRAGLHLVAAVPDPGNLAVTCAFTTCPPCIPAPPVRLTAPALMVGRPVRNAGGGYLLPTQDRRAAGTEKGGEVTQLVVADEVCAAFGDLRIDAVVAVGFEGAKPWPEVEERLASLEARAQAGEFAAEENHPHIASWHAAYRSFGTNPRRQRPSVHALLRRLARSGRLPRISPAVDCYNLVSATGGVPVGAFDLQTVAGQIMIRFADGSKAFTPLGEPDTTENPRPGEVIYIDAGGVLTRHWNHRDADRTKVTEESSEIVFVLETVDASAFGGALDEATGTLVSLLRTRSRAVTVHRLTPSQRAANLSTPTQRP